MRALLLTLGAALVLTAAASARNPRLEQLALRPADVDLAKSAVLRGSDLGSGWTTAAMKPNDTSPPDCPGQNYSKFTITGQAQTRSTRTGASVISRVEVYRSRAGALGDFAIDARPGTAACEGEAVRKGWASGGLAARLISAREVPGPKLGQRSIAFRIVLGVSRAGKEVRVYIDLLGFVRDRVAASVIVLAPGVPPKGNDVLARTIDARLQRVA
jgi:hypothetical protein